MYESDGWDLDLEDEEVRIPNVPLLRKTMEYIEQHPDEWSQDVWSAKRACGTTMCFAGTALHLSGHDFVYQPTNEDVEFAAMVRGFENDGSVGEVAARVLGLSEEQASAIFHCYTSRPDVLRVVVEAAVGEAL